MSILTTTLVVAPAVIAPVVALGVGAYATNRWMQRIAEGTSQMGIVSTATMIDRLTRQIDTRLLRMDELSFVNDIKEKTKTCRIVDLTADEVDRLDSIHGRLFR